ncbi:MAG: sulfotransferase [Phycisphaeraceae bacterium]|nr:MAG: sulfotransferase [Phycisphaeraceae bacterium]
MGIVWIASYPKSGNTWARFLLYALMFGPPERSIDVPKRIPDLHRPLPFDPPASGPLYAKTHFALTDRHPKLAQTERAVHIVRNPRDVLLSGLNYRRLAGADEQAMPAAAYAKTFIARGGDPQWLEQGFGTWADHARSWASTDRFPVHTVRYEDLKTDTPRELKAIAEFLSIETDGDRIAKAAKAASFDAMRALEVREKAAPSATAKTDRLFVGDRAATKKGVYFINAGKTGQTLDPVAPGLDALFDTTFGARDRDMLDRFGYAPE